MLIQLGLIFLIPRNAPDKAPAIAPIVSASPFVDIAVVMQSSNDFGCARNE
jgi:hypothetical protein